MDSQIEHLYFQSNPHLIDVSNESLPFTFTDSQGTVFKAKADFFDKINNTYIELKGHQLNNKPHKAKADSDLAKAITYKGKKLLIDCLRHGWNHSVYKQSIVSDMLKANGLNFKIVFLNLSEQLTPQAKNKLARECLDYQVLYINKNQIQAITH